MARSQPPRSRPHPPSAPLPPVTLSPEEAAAVAVALAAQPEGPYAEAGRAALEKVLDVLEPDPARRAALLATSLWVSAEAGRAAEIRSVLERAITRRKVVVLRYRDGRGRPSRREVEPQLLARSHEHGFLVAWCRERQAPRWFREDRIEEVRLTEETAPRRDPADFGAPPAGNHPAGRARERGTDHGTDQRADRGGARGTATPGRRLVLLPGGRSERPTPH